LTGAEPTPRNVLETLLRLRAAGLRESTIKRVRWYLLDLAKVSDLDNPESVRLAIASKKVKDSYKACLVKAYNYYVVCNGLEWKRPKYKATNDVPNVPTTEFVKQLIATASPRYATIFRLLAETGAMPEELHQIPRRNIDLERGTIKIPGLKGHKTRIIKLKPGMVAMLRRYVQEYQGEYPFPEGKFIGNIYRR